MDDGPFDSAHYAKGWGQKLLRAVQLAPRYYLWDLPRYLRQRRAVGSLIWDPATLWNPMRELRPKLVAGLELPDGCEEALRQIGAAGLRFTLPRARVLGVAAAWWAARNVYGDVMECGSYLGATALFLAVLGRLNNISQSVSMLDTFRGVDEVSAHDVSRTGLEYIAPPGQADAIRGHAAELGVADRVVVYEGCFTTSFARSEVRARRFAMVHVDANLYQSTRDACEFVLPRMSAGAIIVFDDYNGVCDLGARLAIDGALARLALRPRPLAGYSAFVRIEKTPVVETGDQKHLSFDATLDPEPELAAVGAESTSGGEAPAAEAKS
jgi:hypothetical protein